MSEIVIFPHLGLGDCIEINAIIRNYSKNYRHLYTFSKSKYIEIIKYMYRDLENVTVLELDGSHSYEEQLKVKQFVKSNQELLILGHNKYFNNVKQWEDLNFSCGEVFYYLANVDYKKKFQDFYVLRDNTEEERVFNKLNPNNEKYIFIHDDVERGFLINVNTNYKIIKNDTSENIFYMLKILENAEEIHCMSSSMLCLIDCLSEKIDFKNLFLHKKIRNVFAGPNSLSKKWNII